MRMNEDELVKKARPAWKADVRDVVFGLLFFLVLTGVGSDLSGQGKFVVQLASLAGLVFVVRGGLALLGRLLW